MFVVRESGSDNGTKQNGIFGLALFYLHIFINKSWQQINEILQIN